MHEAVPHRRGRRWWPVAALALLVCACLTVEALAVAGGVVLLARVLEDGADPAWPGAHDAPSSTITWHGCTDEDLQRLDAQCGYLTVPLDHDEPDGRTIRLAVSQIRHTSADPQGVMIVNPGGPGGSGTGTVDISDYLPGAVAGRYDWVGFDPRGVGDSLPALRCDPSRFDDRMPGYSPTPQHVAQWTERARTYAAACRRNGALLDHMSTVDSAEDVESLRVALGVPRISYYGFSYGTYLGQVYATLHPDRVRRMILDSTEDARLADDEYGFTQAAAFEAAMERFFDWVARWDDVYGLGRTGAAVRARYDAVGARLETHPTRRVGAAEWSDLYRGAAYGRYDWPDLAEILVEQVRHPGHRGALEDAYDEFAAGDGGEGDDNGYAAYLAVQCTDGSIDRSMPSVLRAARSTADRAPFATWGGAWYGLPCAFWSGPSDRAIEIDGSRVASVLMIDETLDAPTPYRGSLRVRDRFPGARLIAEPGGTTHAGTPDASAPCVVHRIVRYLTDGDLPPRAEGRRADATCPPAPEPVPYSG